MNFRESWTRLDSSKMADFVRCPRYYFYRHCLGWELDRTNIHLIFGESFHRGKEQLLIHGLNQKGLDLADIAFNNYYGQHYTDLQSLDNFPKNPGYAAEAFQTYVEQYKDNLGFEVVSLEGKPATEIYGVVLIAPDRRWHFRLDVLAKTHNDQFMFVDHKTSGMDSSTFQTAWQLSNQMTGYTHVVFSLYGPEKTYGGKVDLTILRKTNILHKRIPIRKSIKSMEEWLWNVNTWYDMILTNVDLICTDDTSKPIRAFPKNDHGCVAFGSLCKYSDLCQCWDNPIQDHDLPPDGFRVEWWDPQDREKEATNFVEVKG